MPGKRPRSRPKHQEEKEVEEAEDQQEAVEGTWQTPSSASYTVERVLDRRVRNHKTEYKLRWKDSWESEENCNCTEILKRFDEDSRKRREQDLLGIVSSAGGEALVEPYPGKTYRIDEGLQLDRILATKPSKQAGVGVVALVQYKDGSCELVPTSVLVKHDPQKVVDFYEARIVQVA